MLVLNNGFCADWSGLNCDKRVMYPDMKSKKCCDWSFRTNKHRGQHFDLNKFMMQLVLLDMMEKMFEVRQLVLPGNPYRLTFSSVYTPGRPNTPSHMYTPWSLAEVIVLIIWNIGSHWSFICSCYIEGLFVCVVCFPMMLMNILSLCRFAFKFCIYFFVENM